MSHFYLQYLSDIYRAFEGDLAMAIVLGEISHHNTQEMFSPQKASNEVLRTVQGTLKFWDGMQGSNAYSMSCATGIPRETVRRKVAELKKRGWVETVYKQGLRITQACADHFGPDYSLRFLNGLLRASRIIEALLADDGEGAQGKKRQPKSTATSKPGTGRTSPPSKSQPKTRKKKT